MDDNTQNNNENQPQDTQQPPIYETVPLDQANQQPEMVNEVPQEPVVEEVAPDVVNTEEAVSAVPQEIPLEEEQTPIYEESKMKYFIIGGGVLFFIFIFILLIALFGHAAPKKNITLTYWGLYEDKQVFDPLIADYEAKNPGVKINYQKMTPDQYKDKLLARKGDGPDIFRYHNTWLPELKDIAAPLPESIMSSSEFDKTFYPIHKTDLKLGDYYYGIPLEVDGLVLIYNDDLLKKAGFDKPPTNIEELTAANSYLQKLTSIDSTTNQYLSSAIAIGTTSNVEHFSDIFGLMLLQNGGDITKLDQPEAAGALESYRKFDEQHIWDSSMPDSIAAFAQEKVAMEVVPTWEILVIKAANPDIKLKVAAIPFNLPGNPSLSLASYYVEGVSKYSKNSLEAWRFLKFLSEKDNLAKLYAQESKTRLFGEPYSRVDMASQLTSNEYLGPFIQQANNLHSMPVISRTFDNGLDDGIVKYIENAINSAARGTTYSDAMNTAQQGVSQVLKQYNIQ